MSNAAVSVHVTVVSATPALPSEGAATPPAGGRATADFSSLLAEKLAVATEVPFPPSPAFAGEGEDPQAASPAGQTPAGEPALPLLPLAAVPNPLTVLPHAPAAIPEEAADVVPAAGMAPAARPQAEGRAANLAAVLSSLPAAVPPGVAAAEARETGLPRVPDGELGAMPGGPGAQTPVAPAAVPADTSAAAHAPLPATATPATAHVATPVGRPGWETEFGQRVVWVARQGEQLAEIHVTPPQLGPIEIRLNLSHDQASLSFVSPHGPVREAIEAALPRLREMLADSGLVLAHVDVSAHGFRKSGQEPAGFAGQGREPAEGYGPASVEERIHAGVGRGFRSGDGLVDVFA